MFYRLKDAFKRKSFAFQVRQILKTRPIATPKKHQTVLLSMLGKNGLIMYLLAAKSILKFIPESSLAILNDGSLQQNDVELLIRHFPEVNFYAMSDIDTKNCPQGGCWERLILVENLVQEGHYVIQFDSDTLSTGEMPEVIECLNNNTSFILCTEEEQKFVTAEQASQKWEHSDNTHIQILAERSLTKIKSINNLRYIRGNAGFAGYAPSSFSYSLIADICKEYTLLLGENKWSEWGSEQFTSNIILSNTSNTRILPYPKYAPYEPSRMTDFNKSVFLHYYGSHRYSNNHYVKSAKKIIPELS